MRFIVEFHHNGKLTKGLNSTFIDLIPKVDSPQRLNDFRPISLVGSLYKIMAKVLANRLRLVIGSVIYESQTTFVKDRQILDGNLIANEAVEEARRTKKGLLLFKVDFEKAYDSVDWGYLECTCTASTSVLVNGSPTDEFPLERGLRQGDPLSPFLFLIAVEGLNVLIQVMFADDTLLLGTKSWVNVRALRVVLVLFETMSDLKVNFNKSMLVGVNIADSWLCAAASALRCKVGNVPFLYLSLPIGGDPRRLGFWEPVLNRIKNLLSGWKSRFLSFGGRLVLLKSVLTSLPVYALSFFKAPSGKLLGLVGTLFARVRRMEDRGLLAARYGVERGCVRAGGRSGSSWWREIVMIRDGVDDLGGGWFGEGVLKKVGDGSETFFWREPWSGGTPLCVRFGRLFDLAVNKSSTMAAMRCRILEGGRGSGGESCGCGRRSCWESIRIYFMFFPCRLSLQIRALGALILSAVTQFGEHISYRPRIRLVVDWHVIGGSAKSAGSSSSVHLLIQ
ncbi:hypothetical protein TSUD_287100 [Trifolium subterraneum]|uniref:Reverse transcriptase domain-containing protein n=1 Tax=Trifolium subterraneum TaxID=3900 RepID=A0A2Z6P0S0_TRISU|nr:hypothetical protein TSUD_287100 [Trifolium subterraneum]